VYINIKVITNAKQTEFVELKPLYYKAKLKAIPEKGLANKELIETVSKFFKCRKSEVKIISGHHSREKLLSIPDLQRNVGS
jgi:uncharacterized protein (TIGR00251 family)